MATKRVAKRNHGAEFKANILAACGQPGASVAAIAVRNGLNANVIYRWLSQSRQGSGPIQSVPVGALDQQISSFIAVQLPESAAPQAVTVATVTIAIRMELRRGTSSVTVVWPSELAGDCGAWLREWLR